MSDFAALSLALVPLDERPVNTRYPQMLAAIAGAIVHLPPPEIRGLQRIPADLNAVAAWLRQTATQVQGAIASAEYLAYGNLINSRISDESVSDALSRLRLLEEIGATGTPVYAFSLITRVSNADDSVEEPLYWSEYGTRFYQYAQLLHRRSENALEDTDSVALTNLERQLPPDHIADWLSRRLRNHAVNLALLDMLARNRLAFLLITSDDTSAWGMPSREKGWLEGWLDLLGESVRVRTMMHPGADEVGSALVARFLCANHQKKPRIFPLYAVPGGEEIIAPYEDRAVRLTVEGQIHACGGVLATSAEESDIILGVLTPSPRRTEFRDSFADAERSERLPHYEKHFQTLAQWQKQGRPVALADVAYPNGADPLAMELLLNPGTQLDPALLCAFGAWNTAGNTLGVVVAQAVCTLFMEGDPKRQQAQVQFLAHRFLEDWGYQTTVRRSVRGHLQTLFGQTEPAPENEAQVAEACRFIEVALHEHLQMLQKRGIGVGLTVQPDSVYLPWRRTFEVDFELVQE